MDIKSQSISILFLKKKKPCGSRSSFREEICLSFRVWSHYVSCVFLKEWHWDILSASKLFSHSQSCSEGAQIWLQDDSGNFVVYITTCHHVSSMLAICRISTWFQWNELSKEKTYSMFSVPSVAPQNVTVRVNESMLLVRWEAPPPNKINGILQGYDVLIDDGKYVNKVSCFLVICRWIKF